MQHSNRILALLFSFLFVSFANAQGIVNSSSSVYSKAGNSQTINFLWSGSVNTASPAASSSVYQPPIFSTINITAQTGVTNLVAQVQMTQDQSTATDSGGVAWTTVATVYCNSPGTGSIVVSVPYLGTRINVTSLAGGNANASLVTGNAPLSSSGCYIQTNPSLVGIAASGPYQISAWGTPVIIPSGGSIGNNGALTLTTALPNAAYVNVFMYFPANAIVAGSTAGVYPVTMSSTTVGTIYNNILTSGPPTFPTSPTPFSTTGPGAYTQTTSAVALVNIPIIGGTMGSNGALRFKSEAIVPNNANTKNIYAFFGGTQFASYGPASQNYLGFKRTIQNMGATNSQIMISTTTSTATDEGASTAAPTYLSINTANNQNLTFEGLVGTGTDYFILGPTTVEALPAQ